MTDIDLLTALDRSCPPSSKPFFDLGQIPDHAAWREGKAAREFAPLLHAEDCAVSERHDFSKLLPPDGASVRHLTNFCHDFGALSPTFRE